MKGNSEDGVVKEMYVHLFLDKTSTWEITIINNDDKKKSAAIFIDPPMARAFGKQRRRMRTKIGRQQNSKYIILLVSNYRVNNNFLLTEREVCTEKYRTDVFFVQTEPLGRGLYKKTEVRYFSVHTEQGRLIKSLLYGIYRHLYSIQTRNA
jgi:hypothetical protein